MKPVSRNCELCESKATVFCPSGSAFLCFTCDSKVHEANFLVARHIRQTICQTCHQMTETGVSGVGFRPFTAACGNCTAADDDDDEVSSDYNSTTMTKTTKDSYRSRPAVIPRPTGNGLRKVRSGRNGVVVISGFGEGEGIFVNWSRRLGVGSGDVAVRTACSGVRVCLDRWKKVLPFRACLAASMWLGIRVFGFDKSGAKLKQLEEISGVPARVIVAAESRLSLSFEIGSGTEESG